MHKHTAIISACDTLSSDVSRTDILQPGGIAIRSVVSCLHMVPTIVSGLKQYISAFVKESSIMKKYCDMYN